MNTIYFLFYVLTLKIFLLSPFMVEGPSMEPSFYNGEIFMINENVKIEDLNRLDVIVFAAKDDPDYFYIKRIIGLPNEKVQIKKEGIYIDGGDGYVKLDENYLKEGEISALMTESYREGYSHTYVVPKNSFFVLGDNRSHSVDSRFFKDPFISFENIKGRYLFNVIKL
jgi:signal peptidase I